jgi:hypothetical protein
MDTTQHEEGDARLAGDLLVGAAAIREYLAFLGIPDSNVYYLRSAGGWPIGKITTGKRAKLIASKRRLARHAEKSTAPQKIDAA